MERSAARHAHLCPRQVLGARLALAAGRALGVDLPQTGSTKRLLVIVESDGCFADGVATATGCAVGRRTLRVEDQGKMAATFVDVATGRALRARPRLDVRERVHAFTPEAPDRWTGYVLGYQRMGDSELVEIEAVRLRTPVARLVSHERARAICAACGEEVANERERHRGARPLCRECAGEGYLSRSGG